MNMKEKRIILHGCGGRMGREIQKAVQAKEGVRIVAGVDPVYALSEEARSLTFPVYASLQDVKEEADGIIDFSLPQSVSVLLQEALRRKLPVVLCTTGLSEEHMAEIDIASMGIPILQSYNMSLGIQALCLAIRSVAPLLYGAGFDIELMEIHHKHKIDAPSGTALLLADEVRTSIGAALPYVYDRSKRREERPKEEIGITSLRMGSVSGVHEVCFGGPDELVTLKHEASSRAVFAHGAVEAFRFLVEAKPGRYTMEDVVKSRLR